MSQNTADERQRRGLSRRSLMKGAAWAAPALIVATTAPAYAASAPPLNGLNGWVSVSGSCTRNGSTLSLDGRGSFTGGGNSDRGIWTFINDPNATLEDVQFIVWVKGSDWTFTNGAAQSGWSNLTLMNPQPSAVPEVGYAAYRATYSGTWTYRPQNGAWVADGHPYWTGTRAGRCTDGQVCIYIDRSLKGNGQTVAFRRGPTCVG